MIGPRPSRNLVKGVTIAFPIAALLWAIIFALIYYV